MHTRRLASFLLGVWLGGIALTLLIATQTSTAADTILNDPSLPVQELTKTLGPQNMRALLRHEAEEQKRAFYRAWDTAQLFLGSVLVLHLLFGTREGWLPVVLSGGMLAIVIVVHLVVTPDLVGFGRGADFLNPGQHSSDSTRAVQFERAYLGGEFLKSVFGAVLLAHLLYRKSGRRRPVRTEINSVDHPDHSHVNG